jgi:hypothetical protein
MLVRFYSANMKARDNFGNLSVDGMTIIIKWIPEKWRNWVWRCVQDSCDSGYGQWRVLVNKVKEARCSLSS